MEDTCGFVTESAQSNKENHIRGSSVFSVHVSTCTCMYVYVFVQVFLQLLPTILMLSSDGSANTTSTSLPVSLTAPSNNAIVFVW